MPNRIIKESICTSASIDGLCLFHEVFFYRLIVNVDDYGRMDARIPILRSRLFPLKQIPDSEIWEALIALRERRMIDLYRVEDCLYLQICSWEKHQRIRAKVSKFPPPNGELMTLDGDLLSNVSESLSNASVIQSNPIQSESYSRERNAPAPIHAHACEKKAFGSFRNVMLTEEEHEKLLKDLSDGADLIERFSKRLAAKGYKYDDHYAAILCWKEEDQRKRTPEEDEYWQDFFEAACRRPLRGT